MTSAASKRRWAAQPPDVSGGPTPSSDGERLSLAACLLVPAIVMAVVASIGLKRDNAMGNDEVATRWAAGLTLHQLGHLLGNLDAVHGLYYLFMHAWLTLGSSPTILRVPSVAAMSVGAAAVAALGRRLTGSARAGLFAGLLTALTPSISYYAQTARSYAFVFAGVAITTLLLLRAADVATEDPALRAIRVRRWAAYAALVTVTGYLNELSLVVLVAHGVALLLSRAGKRVLTGWAAAAVVGAVLVLPLIIISRREDSVLNALAPPTANDVRVLWHDYFGGTVAAAVVVSVCAVVGMLVAHRWPTSRGSFHPTPLTVALPLLVVPGTVLMLEALVSRPLYTDRYVLFGEIGAAVLAGSALEALAVGLRRVLRHPALLLAPGLAVCLVVGLIQVSNQRYLREPRSRQFDFGGPAYYIAARAQRGDGLLFMDSFFRKGRLGYPKQYAKVTDLALAVPPRRTGNFRGRDKPYPQVQSLVLARSRIWVEGLPPTHLGHLGPYVHQEAALLLTRFRLVAERRWGRITVTLWQRR